MFLALSRPQNLSDFSNWDPTFQLAVGNELTANRLWRGQIHAMTIHNEAIEGKTIGMLHSRGPGAMHASQGLGVGSVLFDLPQEMQDSDSLWGLPLLDAERNRELCDALVQSGTMSVLVWFRARDPDQVGPARIVTFSKNPFLSNFTIGQEVRRIIFRLRTPQTGPVGHWPQAVTPELIDPDTDVFVAATYDGRVSRVYVDGRLMARVNLLARGWKIPFLADSGIPAAATLFGMLLATALLSIGTTAAARRKWILAPLTGLIGGLLLLFVDATAAVPEVAAAVPLFSLGGGLIVAAASTFHTRLRI